MARKSKSDNHVMGDEFEYDVFLSHNSGDKPAVEELAHRLRKEGIEPWLDKWNLIPGDPWQEAIEEALDKCKTCAVFVGPGGVGPWQNEEMRAAIDRRVSEASRRFRVIPIVLPGGQRDQRSRLPTFLVATTWVEFRRSLDDEEALHRLISGIRGVAPGPLPSQPLYEGICPYRGLEAFQEEHTAFFFGRDALTEWLLDHLRSSQGLDVENRFLAIVGASGSGKSSLARAGLIPALKHGLLDSSEHWPVVICRPGQDPTESISVALSADASVGQRLPPIRDLMSDLLKDERSLHITVRKALHSTPKTSRLVLLVDQFEEIFTLCQDESLRQAAISNLVYAAGVTRGQTLVVLTMRADFYGKCAKYGSLAAALSDNQILVGLLTEEELHQAIERPALLVGCELESGLAQLLIEDAKDKAGALPLLQYTLSQLWNGRKNRVLTVAAYHELGGLKGALEQRANAIFEGLDDKQKAICKRIFLNLTQTGEGAENTKRRASVNELLTIGDEPTAVHSVVQALANGRLVTTEGKTEAFIEVAHEALIQGWSRLRMWVNEDREFLLWRQRLRTGLVEWERTGRDSGAMLRGALLTESERWLAERLDDLSPAECEFIQTSSQSRQQDLLARKRQRKRITIGLASGLVVALILSAFAGMQWWRAEEQRKQADWARRRAELSFARQLLAQSESAQQYSDPQRALLVGIESARLFRSQGVNSLGANQVLSHGLALMPQKVASMKHEVRTEELLFKMDSQTNTVFRPETGVIFSEDGKSLAVASGFGDVRVFAVDDGKQTETIEPRTEFPRVAVFSPDRRFFATAIRIRAKEIGQSSSNVRVSEWNKNKISDTVEVRVSGLVHAIAFSQDANYMATVAVKGERTSHVSVWDWRKNVEKPLSDTTVRGRVLKAVFGPDARSLALNTVWGDLQLWDWGSDNSQPEEIKAVDEVLDMDFSPDGKLLATLNGHEKLRVWQINGWNEVWQTPPQYAVAAFTFSENGTYLAGGLSDNTVRLWNVQSWKEVNRVPLEGKALALAFSPDEQRLATTGQESTTVWKIPASNLTHKQELDELSFSTDGEYLATISKDFNSTGRPVTVQVWHLDGDTLRPDIPRVHEGKTSNIVCDSSVVFSPNSEYLVSLHEGVANVWEWKRGGPPRVINVGTTSGPAKLSFSPSSKNLATSGSQVSIWDLQSNNSKPLAVLGGYTGGFGVWGVSFSPDGKYLATATSDAAYVWDWQMNDKKAVIHLPHKALVADGFKQRQSDVTFSSDGDYLATFAGNTVEVWKWQTKPSHVFRNFANDGNVTDIDFSPDGKYLASSSQTGFTRVWELSSGREINRIQQEKQVESIGFSPDGKYLATITDKTVSLWLWNPNNLIAEACLRLTRNLSFEEWRQFFGNDDYRKTCEHLPESDSYINAKRRQATLEERKEAQEVLERGDDLAIAGKIPDAIAEYQKASELDPSINLRPEDRIRKEIAWSLQQIEFSSASDNIQEVIADFEDAIVIDNSSMSAHALNNICWRGSLHGHAKDVLCMCEKAAKREPEDWTIRDSRALCRALNGDFPGAIKDFQFAVEQEARGITEEWRRQRIEWIRELRAGRNPFDEETIRRLQR